MKEIQIHKAAADSHAAQMITGETAEKGLGEYMLLSWYDKDRDFESPQHSSECHLDSAVPGYVDYGLNHGTCQKVGIDDGRYVYFYHPLDD